MTSSPSVTSDDDDSPPLSRKALFFPPHEQLLILTFGFPSRSEPSFSPVVLSNSEPILHILFVEFRYLADSP